MEARREMKLIAAQILPVPGEYEKNITRHIDVIHQAASQGADLVLFPELSLTGYEPRLAEVLAVHPSDGRFDEFQRLSDLYGSMGWRGTGLSHRAGGGDLFRNNHGYSVESLILDRSA